MEPLTMVIGVTFTIGAMVAALFVFSKLGFANSEDSYEETIARQKEILLDDAKSKADKKKLKAEKKKKAPKFKQEGTATSASEADATAEESEVNTGDELTHQHVEYDPDPVVIEEVASTETVKLTSKLSQKKPAKSILVNKTEAPVVNTNIPIAETHFEQLSPKDDVQLKLEHRVTKKGKKEKPAKKDHQPQPVEEAIVAAKVDTLSAQPNPVEEQIVAVDVLVVSAAPTQATPAPNKKSGKQAKSASKGSDNVSITGLLENIQRAAFTREELQTLVDGILANQTEDNWTTKSSKPDPLTSLRKQLEDVQAALAEKQANLESSQAKVKELNSRTQTAERTSSYATAQIQELQKRMQQTHEQHKREIQELNSKMSNDKQSVSRYQEQIRQLEEDKLKLQKSVSDATTDSVSKLVDTERTNQDLRKELNRYEDDMRQMDIEKTNLKALCERLEREKQVAEEKSTESEDKLQALHEKMRQAVFDKSKEAEQNINSLQQQLKKQQTDLDKAVESERNVKNLEDQLRQQKADYERELQAMKDDMKKFSENLQKTAASTNGKHDAMNGEIGELEKQVSALTSTIQEKDRQLNNLNKELTAAKASSTELGTLRKQYEHMTTTIKPLEVKVSQLEDEKKKLADKNNDLVRKNWALNDALDKAEAATLTSQSSVQGELEKQRSHVKQLTDSNEKLQSKINELEKRCESMAQTDTQFESQQSEIQKLQTTLSYNQKASEGYVRTIDELKSKSQKENDDHDKKLKQMEDRLDKLHKEFQILESEKRQLEARVEDLSSRSSAPSTPQPAKGSDPEAKLVQYKKALALAERMLDDLSSKVESEQSKWNVELDTKDKEIAAMKQLLDKTFNDLDRSKSLAQQALKDNQKIKELTSQLEEAKKTAVDLKQKESEHVSKLANMESLYKDEQIKNRRLAQELTVAIAANGNDDAAGTCV